MAQVAKAENRNTDEDDFKAQAKEYVFIKKQLEYFEAKQKEFKEKLFERIEANGEVDSEGHIILDLEEPIDGVLSFKKQRRVGRKINEDRAEEIIEEKGLEKQLYKTIQVIDEDALMAALYSDLLTESEIEEMYPQIITWALVMNKKK